MQECDNCEEATFTGVGLGVEHRYDGAGLMGTVLAHDGQLIHAALHRRTPPTPYPRSYWVRPGRFLVGYYPGDVSKAAAKKQISSLLDAGIKCVVNLVEEDEKGAGGKSRRSYSALLSNEAKARHIDVSYIRIPIPDVSVPSASTMRLILGAVDGALNEGRPTYIHCWGGRGRTGTVVGCYLTRHCAESDEDALATIERLREGEVTALKPSPETTEQRDMVRAWVENGSADRGRLHARRMEPLIRRWRCLSSGSEGTTQLCPPAHPSNWASTNLASLVCPVRQALDGMRNGQNSHEQTCS